MTNKRKAGGSGSSVSLAKPNYVDWCKAAYWKFDEALWLLLECDPDLIEASHGKISEALQTRFDRLRRLAERANYVGLLSKHGTSGLMLVEPGAFLAWARTNEIEIPIDLEQVIATRDGAIGNYRMKIREAESEIESLKARVSQAEANAKTNTREQKPLTDAERRVALSIIVALAVKKCDFDIRSAPGPLTNKIVGYAAEVGLPIDDNSVRSWLAKGADLALRAGAH